MCVNWNVINQFDRPTKMKHSICIPWIFVEKNILIFYLILLQCSNWLKNVYGFIVCEPDGKHTLQLKKNDMKKMSRYISQALTHTNCWCFNRSLLRNISIQYSNTQTAHPQRPLIRMESIRTAQFIFDAVKKRNVKVECFTLEYFYYSHWNIQSWSIRKKKSFNTFHNKRKNCMCKCMKSER